MQGWYTSVCTSLQLIDINEWCPPTHGGAAPRLDPPASARRMRSRPSTCTPPFVSVDMDEARNITQLAPGAQPTINPYVKRIWPSHSSAC